MTCELQRRTDDPPPNHWHTPDCRWFPERNNKRLPLMAAKVYPKWCCPSTCSVRMADELEERDT